MICVEQQWKRREQHSLDQAKRSRASKRRNGVKTREGGANHGEAKVLRSNEVEQNGKDEIRRRIELMRTGSDALRQGLEKNGIDCHEAREQALLRPEMVDLSGNSLDPH